MDNTPQGTPPAGPPKKGFWGFLAGFFPKQPTPPSHVEQPAQPPQAPDAAPASDTTAETPQPLDSPTSAPAASPTQEPQLSAPVAAPAPDDLLARPVPTIDPSHDPQPLAVPESLEAEPIQADGTKVSPTLETQPPAPANEFTDTQQQPSQTTDPAPVNPPVSVPTNPVDSNKTTQY